MKNPYILYLLLFFIVPVSLLAQKNPKSIKEKSNTKTSYVLTDLSYINDAVFMGRRDSIAAPYILPSIGYYDKSGLFADATLSYLVGSEENRVDLFLQPRVIFLTPIIGVVEFQERAIFTINLVTMYNRKLLAILRAY